MRGFEKLNKWLQTVAFEQKVSTQNRIPSFQIQIPRFDVDGTHIWVI